MSKITQIAPSVLASMNAFPDIYNFFQETLLSGEVITRFGEVIGKPWPEGVVPIAEWHQWLVTRTHPIYLLAKKDHLPQLKEIALERGVEVVDLGSKYWAILLPTPAGN